MAGADMLDGALRLRAGFSEDERPHVLEALASLGPHLARWEPEDIALELSVKDRGDTDQRVTLQATLPGLPPLVATSADRDLDHALAEVKRDLIRQLEDAKGRRSPKDNRMLRKRV
jgi:ribosome-associated translation inhibitor RaiA